MQKNLKEEIAEYVDNWHYDEESEIYAFEMGKFIFSFINYLEDQNLSERTLTNASSVHFYGIYQV